MEDKFGQVLYAARPDLAGRPVGVRPVRTGKFNRTYRLEVDGEAFALRIAPPRDAVFVFYERGMMAQEPGLHALLRARTSVPVPEVIVYDDSGRLLEREYILMAWLPGRPWSEASGVPEERVLGQLGEMLAEVHGLTAGRYGYLGEHRPMEPQGSWGEAFAIMWHKLIDDVVDRGYYDAVESRFMRDGWEAYRRLFEREVSAALLHMDVWQQNVLVDGRGTVTGLLDWDRGLWGDPEIEFAVLDYCGLSGPAFWEGYGRPRDLSPAAQKRRLFYLLYELQKYIVIYDGRNGEPDRAREKKRQVISLAERAFSSVGGGGR